MEKKPTRKYQRREFIKTATKETVGVAVGGLIGFLSGSNEQKGIAGFSNIFAGFDLIQKEINVLKNPIKRNLRDFL